MNPAGSRSVLASALISLSIAVPALRAEEIPYQFKGVVTLVGGAATAELAEHGVIVGAEVIVDYVLDSDVVGVPGVDPEFVSYELAVLEMKVAVGTYEAYFAPHQFFEIFNRVLVADDLVEGQTTFDRYSLSASGGDTDTILHNDVATQPVIMLLGFGDVGGTAIGDEGLLQDPQAFPGGDFQVSGPNGLFQFEFVPDGPGPDPDPVDPTLSAAARRGQLKAAAGFANAVFAAKAKGVSAPPDKDPLGTKEANAITKAGDTFAKQFEQAIEKALGKGGTAPLPASALPQATATVLEGAADLTQSVATGVDENVAPDRVLRGKILAAASKAARKDLLAYAADAKKPSAETLASKLTKSEDALAAAIAKALATAEKKGVVYAGPGAAEVAAAVDALVEEYVLLTQGTGVRP